MKFNLKKHWRIIFSLFVLGLLLLTFFLYLLYFSSERSALLNRKINAFMEQHPKARLSLRKALKISDAPFTFYTTFFQDNLESYHLTIKRGDYQELQDNIAAYIKDGDVEKFKKEVPGEFKKNGETVKVEVRYRGDNPNHWAHEKKSWRINFKTPFESKESINLIIPEDREYFLEIFSNHVARKMGLLVPEMKFVNLFVNGERQGVYLMTEHWSESFLEQNGLIPESDLFGEGNLEGVSYLYSSPANFQKYTTDSHSQVDNFANLQTFLDYLNDLEDEGFYKKIEEILDLENFLTWEAHSTLMFSRAQRATHNVILLFNKEKGKFQFVPWNAFTGDYEIKTTPIDIDYHPMVTRILKNPEWLYLRNKILWQYLSREGNEQEDFKFYDQLFKETCGDFYKDRLKLFTNLEFLLRTKKHRERLKDAYEKIGKELEKSSANVYLRQRTKPNNYSDRVATLEIESGDFSSVMIKDLEIELEATPASGFKFFRDKNGNDSLDTAEVLIGDFKKEEEKKYKIAPDEEKTVVHTERELYKGTFYPKTTRQAFFITSAKPFYIQDMKIKINNAVTGKKAGSVTTRFLDESVFQYLDKVSLTPEEFVKEYPLFKRQGEKFILPGGTYSVNKPVVIPRGLELEIQPGAVLRFAKGAFLLSYGRIRAEGTERNPIIFTSQRADEPWGVLGLVDKEASGGIFKHIILENASEAYVNGIFFSGGLAAHYADVTIKDSLFRHNHGDDAVNVKHARAEIRNSQFLENDFDAIDFDSTDGVVEGNLFVDNGNDAFDISFSKAHFKNNKVQKSGDKCVSVGEKSEPEIYENSLERCLVGVAVKDRSKAKIYNNKIINCQTGIGAYQKKEIFGGGEALIRDNELAGNEKDFEKDEVSKIEEF